MRILFYVPSIMLDGYKGEYTHTRELAEALARLGHDITVICRLGTACYGGRANVVRVRTCGNKDIAWVLAAVSGFFPALRELKTNSYDIVYTRGGHSAPACLLARAAQLPCVTEVNGLIWDEARCAWVGWHRKAVGYILDRMDRIGFKHSTHLVAVTTGIRDILTSTLGIAGQRVSVVPNGANLELFRPMDKLAARRRLGLEETATYICFVGVLVRWQGVDVLIRSLRLVASSHPRLRCLVVGDGAMRQELERLADAMGVGGRVSFAGMVPYEQVPVYINASDICVAPFTRQRNEKGGVSPLKIYEYAGCGRSIVASDLPGVQSVQQARAALLVLPDSEEALAEALQRLLETPDVRETMGRNGREWALQHGWDTVGAQVAEVCKRVIHDWC